MLSNCAVDVYFMVTVVGFVGHASLIISPTKEEEIDIENPRKCIKVYFFVCVRECE
jgi:hypothetical protein